MTASLPRLTRRNALAGGVALVAAPGIVGRSKAAEPEVTWKVQSHWPKASASFDESLAVVAEKVKDRTDGKMVLELYGAGEFRQGPGDLQHRAPRRRRDGHAVARLHPRRGTDRRTGARRARHVPRALGVRAFPQEHGAGGDVQRGPRPIRGGQPGREDLPDRAGRLETRQVHRGLCDAEDPLVRQLPAPAGNGRGGAAIRRWPRTVPELGQRRGGRCALGRRAGRKVHEPVGGGQIPYEAGARHGHGHLHHEPGRRRRPARGDARGLLRRARSPFLGADGAVPVPRGDRAQLGHRRSGGRGDAVPAGGPRQVRRSDRRDPGRGGPPRAAMPRRRPPCCGNSSRSLATSEGRAGAPARPGRRSDVLAPRRTHRRGAPATTPPGRWRAPWAP